MKVMSVEAAQDAMTGKRPLEKTSAECNHYCRPATPEKHEASGCNVVVLLLLARRRWSSSSSGSYGRSPAGSQQGPQDRHGQAAEAAATRKDGKSTKGIGLAAASIRPNVDPVPIRADRHGARQSGVDARREGTVRNAQGEWCLNPN